MKRLFLLTFFLLQTFHAAYAAVNVTVAPHKPWLLAEQAQRTVFAINFEGIPAEKTVDVKRSPVNIALVIDVSGSMEGAKLSQAIEAAHLAVNLLDAEDVMSIVTYSDQAFTLVPAQYVREKETFHAALRRLRAGGGTALFSGVSAGLREIEKFRSPNRVHRVVLLSDGEANIGPSSPSELAELGRAAAKSRISVTTIGLGLQYNEDLMTQLAMASDGNHAFVENYADLTKVFERELQSTQAVVAQNIDVVIVCPHGVRPLSTFDSGARIQGNQVILQLNQVYSAQKKVFLFEVEVDPQKAGRALSLAEVRVNYRDPFAHATMNFQGVARVNFTRDTQRVANSINRPVAEEWAITQSNQLFEQAIISRDQNKTEEANQLMLQRAELLRRTAEELSSDKVQEKYKEASSDQPRIQSAQSPGAWQLERKKMKNEMYENRSQNSIRSSVLGR